MYHCVRSTHKVGSSDDITAEGEAHFPSHVADKSSRRGIDAVEDIHFACVVEEAAYTAIHVDFGVGVPVVNQTESHPFTADTVIPEKEFAVVVHPTDIVAIRPVFDIGQVGAPVVFDQTGYSEDIGYTHAAAVAVDDYGFFIHFGVACDPDIVYF